MEEFVEYEFGREVVLRNELGFQPERREDPEGVDLLYWRTLENLDLDGVVVLTGRLHPD